MFKEYPNDPSRITYAHWTSIQTKGPLLEILIKNMNVRENAEFLVPVFRRESEIESYRSFKIPPILPVVESLGGVCRTLDLYTYYYTPGFLPLGNRPPRL